MSMLVLIERMSYKAVQYFLNMDLQASRAHSGPYFF